MKLIDIFEDYPDEDEMIWNFIGTNDFEEEDFHVKEENIAIYATNEFISRYNKYAQPWQKALVDEKRDNIEEVKDIPIVVHQDIVIDGNHRLMAMYLAGIKKINVIEV